LAELEIVPATQLGHGDSQLAVVEYEPPLGPGEVGGGVSPIYLGTAFSCAISDQQLPVYGVHGNSFRRVAEVTWRHRDISGTTTQHGNPTGGVRRAARAEEPRLGASGAQAKCRHTEALSER